MECQECGYESNAYNFRQGCPLCGCWDMDGFEQGESEFEISEGVNDG